MSSSPIHGALGGSIRPPSPQSDDPGRSDFRSAKKPGDALRAKTTPGKRMPVIDLTKADPEVLKAAQGMEAMFLDYMMQTMRKTIPDSEMNLESPATKIYRGMLDSEMAEIAARTGGVGLAEQIVAYLDAQRYNLNDKGSERTPSAIERKSEAVESFNTGGSRNAGRPIQK